LRISLSLDPGLAISCAALPPWGALAPWGGPAALNAYVRVFMNFRPRPKEEPEINLIPFIDVLLVILIFLMLSTTYSKFTELQLKLPVADVEAQRDYPKEVLVSVNSEGNYSVNKQAVTGRSVEDLASALQSGATAGKESVVIIHADASARHQAVITVMEAARRAGLTHITFATQSSANAGSP
jgi:biopolymer transport protein ExbD